MSSYRVGNPDTLAQLAKRLGEPVLEAIRLPGRTGSTFRVWNRHGWCYTITPVRGWVAKRRKALTGAFTFKPAVRTIEFDRTLASLGV